MATKTCIEPLSDATLAEHWFSLRNKTWRKVAALVRKSPLEQREIAARIGMDESQFSRIVTGKKANATLRTLHNIARALDHRLDVELTPLPSLAKPNYSYRVQPDDHTWKQQTDFGCRQALRDRASTGRCIPRPATWKERTMKCDCPKKVAPESLRFTRCQRGFMLMTGRDYDGIGQAYAFNRVEEAAQWLVEQYGDA